MKVLVLGVVLLVVCVVLFALGVFSPRKSRRMQRSVDELSKKGEDKGRRTGGPLGDMTGSGLEKARSAADASARAGRRLNEALGGDRETGPPEQPP